MPAEPPEPNETPRPGNTTGGGPGWTNPPGPSDGRESGQAPDFESPQEWAAPPGQEGQGARASPTEGPAPPKLTKTAGVVLCLGGVVYTLLLAGLLTITTVLVMFGLATQNLTFVLGAPVTAVALGALLYWFFLKVLAHTGVPSAGSVMVLFTVIAGASLVQVGVLFFLHPAAHGFHPVAPAAVIALVVAVVVWILQGRNLRWAVLVLTLALLVRAVVEWQLSEAEHDRLFAEAEDAFAAHPHDVAMLDSPDWTSYRAEVSEARHPDRDETDDVFTVYYRSGPRTHLRVTTWADEETRRDPERVLRAWCGDEGVVCEGHETDTGNPVVLLHEPGSGSTPQSARVEYDSGAVAFLGPWSEPVPDLAPGETGRPAPTDIEGDLLRELAGQLRTAEAEEVAELSRLTTEFALERRTLGE